MGKVAPICRPDKHLKTIKFTVSTPLRVSVENHMYEFSKRSYVPILTLTINE